MSFDETQYLTVSELNANVRELLEEEYPDLAVLGEISNFKRHSSGHLYFRLKDASAQLDAVCFRSDAQRIEFDPEDGMDVMARGRVTVYEAWGRYQLVVYRLEQTGMGALEVAFRKLRDRLEREGLFAAEHKKPLPPYPQRVAVVTSPTGAALRDIVSTFRRRWPPLEILVCPVHVQGAQSAPEIVRVLKQLETVQDLDIVIVGRGGGSLEDLWSFNEESVARAIFECPIPVISAVGHETDFTIADFVADARAATPTMAAEIATPRADEVRRVIERITHRLVDFIEARLDVNRGRLREFLRSYALGRVRSRIEQLLQTNDYAIERLHNRITASIRERRAGLDTVTTRLRDLDATAILRRGYAICSDEASGRILRSAVNAAGIDVMRVTFHDGDVLTEIKEAADERREG
jgi:exodeoxyribonuclease VII large subunit